jgi:hypothetical protein
MWFFPHAHFDLYTNGIKMKLSNTFKRGCTLMKKILSNIFMGEVKMVSGNPKPPHCSNISENG